MRSLESIAEDIFDVVERDLRYRHGIGDEWDSADYHTIEEIRTTNTAKILEILQKRFTEDK